MHALTSSRAVALPTAPPRLPALRARHPRLTRLPAATLLYLTCAVAAAAEPATPSPAGGYYAVHERDGYTVEVSVDPAEPAAAGTYDIVLANAQGAFLRYSGNRKGMPTGSWVADLDEDERFEVIVATAVADGEGEVRINEWVEQDQLLEAVPLAPLGPELAALHQGGDRYLVDDDTLYRSFPLRAAGEATDAGKTARLRYDFDEGRWEKAKRFVLF